MTTNLKTANILGVNVACTSIQDIIARVTAWTELDEQRTVMYVNAHIINIAKQDALFLEILNRADLVCCDGIGVVWAAKILGGCQLEKITGADWIYSFCESAERTGLRIYLLAGKPGIAMVAKQNLQNRYPGLKIVGVSDGYFVERNEQTVLTHITDTQPDLIFVGMGSPVQEKWINSNRDDVSAPVCWAVGALFDYVADVEPRAPKWMNASGLEWLWRLIHDPSGKWERYLFGIPRFVYRILREAIRTRRPGT